MNFQTACPAPKAACRPVQWQCCGCERGTQCPADFVWVCADSSPGCPDRAPPAGSPCTLSAAAKCLYCDLVESTFVCNAGVWSPVSGAYCAAG
jgi:hypothetical protein